MSEDNLLREIVSCLTYEYAEAGSRVFEYGTLNTA